MRTTHLRAFETDYAFGYLHRLASNAVRNGQKVWCCYFSYSRPV